MKEHDPSRYREISTPRSDEEAEASIKAFFEAVQDLRIQHKLPDVHVVIKVNVDTGTGEVPAYAVGHFGALQEAESMCAYAFARAGEERKRGVDWAKEQGISSYRKASR